MEKERKTAITNAEIDAMAELNCEDIRELVRITTQFSEYMKQKFIAIGGETP